MIYEFWITWAELLFFQFFREFLGPIIQWEILREIIFTRTSGLLYLWGLSIAVMFFLYCTKHTFYRMESLQKTVCISKNKKSFCMIYKLFL